MRLLFCFAALVAGLAPAHNPAALDPPNNSLNHPKGANIVVRFDEYDLVIESKAGFTLHPHTGGVVPVPEADITLETVDWKTYLVLDLTTPLLEGHQYALEVPDTAVRNAGNEFWPGLGVDEYKFEVENKPFYQIPDPDTVSTTAETTFASTISTTTEVPFAPLLNTGTIGGAGGGTFSVFFWTTHKWSDVGYVLARVSDTEANSVDVDLNIKEANVCYGLYLDGPNDELEFHYGAQEGSGIVKISVSLLASHMGVNADFAPDEPARWHHLGLSVAGTQATVYYDGRKIHDETLPRGVARCPTGVLLLSAAYDLARYNADDFGLGAPGNKCVDYPSTFAHDSGPHVGATCKTYEGNAWCTTVGGKGAGWIGSYGDFSDHVLGNWDASQACCVCGGGQPLGVTYKDVRFYAHRQVPQAEVPTIAFGAEIDVHTYPCNFLEPTKALCSRTYPIESTWIGCDTWPKSPVCARGRKASHCAQLHCDNGYYHFL